MSYYSIDVSRTVKMDLTIKYKCENCGKVSSYTQPYEQTINESGNTSTKSNSAVQQLSNKLVKKAQKQAQEMVEDWKNKGPDSFEYHISYESCPHCGYYQSWMLKYLKQRRRSKYIKWPIVIVSVVLIYLHLYVVQEILNDLIGDLSGLVALIILVLAGGLTYFIGNKFVDPNRNFQEIETVNEPKLTWSDPIITN